jgi:hypothetical protein
MHRHQDLNSDRVQHRLINPSKLRRHGLSIVFVVFLVVPLYLLLISVVARSDLLRFWGDPFTDNQFQALFAFLGVALGVVATTLGALLAKTNSDRTIAQKEESELRMLVQTQESNNRQKLDTAIQVLNLIKNEDQYAGRAVTGAGIATLVVLGYPVIAMRTLQAAMGEGVVDSASATWVIDQVLAESLRPRGSHTPALGEPSVRPEQLPSREEAAQLLYDHVSVLTKDDVPGACDWPSCALGQWPTGLSLQCGWTLMLALLRLLVSRPARWWTSGDDTWSWVIFTLHQITRDDSSAQILRGEAATYALLLLPALGGATVNGSADERFSERDMRTELATQVEPDRVASNDEMRTRVEAWIRDAVAGGRA